jgi:hypothetical protein
MSTLAIVALLMVSVAALLLVVGVGMLWTWRHAVAVTLAVGVVAGWIGLYFFVPMAERHKALLLVALVSAFVAVIIAVLEWWLFYEADRDDVFRVDSRGIAIGHKGVPKERRQNALLVGGDELPTRRIDGTNTTAFLVKEWVFRDGAPDIFVVPPEASLPPDEAAAHVGKMIKADERLEQRSRALDLLEHSIVGLCEKAYKKGKGHAMVARQDLSAASDLTVNYHSWVQEKKDKVRENVEALKNATGEDVEDADGVDDIKHGYDGVEDEAVRDEVEASTGAETNGTVDEATHE